MSRTNQTFIDDELEQEKAYWLRQLSGELVTTGLPLDYRRAPEYRAERAVVPVAFAPTTQASLFGLCGANESLALTALVAVLKICLHKYTGAEDIIVGTPIHKQFSEVAELNRVLALRDTVRGETTVKELLLSVKETLNQAYVHQKYPFERVLALVGAEHPHNRAPLFNAVVLLTNVNRREHVAHLKNDLTLVFTVEGGRLAGEIEYNAALFKRESVEVFAAQFAEALAAALGRPEAKVAELSLLSAEGEQRALAAAVPPRRAYPAETTAHRLFEQQAARTPQAIAVEFEGAQLTYGELNERANRLARHLQTLGVGQGVRVGVYAEHCTELVVAVLAVLKTGGAYVPVDPDHPKPRVSFMLKDAEAPVLITQRRLAEGLALEGVSVVELDGDNSEFAHHDGGNLDAAVSPADLAYVIYTSGSTGEPKGVRVRHRSLVNYVTWAMDSYLRGESLDFALYSSLSFDLTVTSVYTPLLTGNRIVVYRREGRESPVAEIMRDDRVGVLKLTPSHLALIKDRDNTRSRIRRLIVGGEALETELARQVWESFGGGVEIYNEYGPTEATVGCMIHLFDPARDDRAQVPIGVPAANTEIYVLDEQLRPTATNVPGELYIAGDGLAEGYHHRAQLTEEKFIAHPFRTGERMYRTGDVARRLPGGLVEYLGRRDEQVKFHGYRVELNEIKSELNRHPQVRDSVVAVRRDRKGNDVMVAYYVSRHELEAAQLREFLLENVIEQTIPNLFVHLRRLPLTLNGKVNHAALPTVEEAREKLRREYTAPRTAAEEQVAAIWGEVLSVERVGVDDNFFELGGHSLLATQVVSRVREIFGIELGLRGIFEWPTVAELAEHIAAGVAQSDAPPTLPITRRADAARPAPLSSAQKRLWFLHQYDPTNPFYNVPGALRLQGRLDRATLEQTLGEIIRRHEALRTSFPQPEGEPVQLVSEAGSFQLPFTDLSNLDAAPREAELDRLRAEESHTPFDLERAPLVRARLVRLAAEDHVLLLTMHHIISDGWSMGVLAREASALYAAYAAGEGSPLAELEIQYADYAAWEQEWSRGASRAADLAYWKRHLEGAPAALELPTDRPPQPAGNFIGASAAFALSPRLTGELHSLGRQAGATLFMTLLSAFHVLLHKYTGQDDIVIGTPIAGRTRRETEGLIGCFVNTLALRTKAEAGDSFLTLLGRVREAAIGAYAHQELPFEQLVEEMHPERGQTHTPLFQVMFALQNAPAGALSLPGLSLSYFEEGSRRAGSEMTLAHLTLIMEENAEGLRGSLLYNAGLFTEASVARLLGHFETLLAGIAADPRQNLSHLSLLSDEERSRLLHHWNDTTVAFPRQATLAELFAEQAARRPEAVALAFGDERLTYAELDARANQLARYLRAQGVARESLVGLCVERSMEMVVGLLGILKAGAAYLPLDPEYPRERLSYMLADARPAVVLTQERLEAGLPEQAARVLRLDTDWPLIAAERTDSPGLVSTADNLAYVTYTSGSTGRPKGVGVTQRNVARLVKGADFASFDEAEVFLQMAPITFDASTFEIWGSLLNGARLVVMPPGRASLEELGRVLNVYGVTTLWLTAGLFHLMVDERLADLRGLRQLLAGGDVLSPAHVQKFLAGAGSQCRLINGYGPTENTTFTCCYPMTAGLELDGGVPIGRPIANTRVYVLDANLQPVLTGAAGELYTGGDGLARGYVNQPALTAARFIPDPFAAAPGSRLYRTGDLARYLADGRLEFLGRSDEQVKVRGYRIELGEVEAALRAAPGVRDCAVAAREDATGGRTLVAYFVGGGEGAILRERLAETLPAYMVPSAFVKLEALPLTPNGKLDRRALPEPVVSETASHTEGLRPIEELVAGLFAELLGAERVGVEADFFELGGHSLLATRLATRLREIFKIQLPLRVVFEAATPSGIASAIADALRDAEHATPPPPILPGRRGRQLPLSYAQQRLWFLNQLEPESAAYNVLTAVRLRGEFDAQAVGQSLAELVRRHEALRTIFNIVDGQPTQVVKATMPVSLGQVDLSAGDEADREEAVRQAIRAEAGQPFDLGRGPLVRARLLRLSAEEHVLVLAMHHIVSDGWSMEILVRELTALYESFRRGETPPPVELRVQYADYACWQREWLRGEALESQLAYWRQQLGGHLPSLELPTDYARPATLAHHGATESFTLAEDVARDLKAVSRREGVTLFMTLLAAFQTLLLRYTGQDDIIVGSPIANRTTAETEGLIGCFINTLALRTDLSGGVTFSELLRRVREVTLGAYAHQDVPFELLVEELQPERKANYSPIFQVWFVLHNAPARPAALTGLALSQEPVETGTAQFDLTMAMSESGGTLGGSLTYNTELFRRETALRMLDHFQELLREVARDPEQPLLDIPLVRGQAAVAPVVRTGARAVGEVEDQFVL